MAKKNSLKTAEAISKVFNHKDIVSYTNCMTRLRVTVKKGTSVDQEQLKAIDDVLGVIVSGTEYQIVLGPGYVNQVANDFKKFVVLNDDEVVSEDIVEQPVESFKTAAEIGAAEKSKLRAGGNVKKFFAKISKVFTPLIPAFIGAGLLSGIAGIILSSGGGASDASASVKSWNTVLSFSLAILTNVFIIAVGWRLGDEFGGNPGLSALIAAMFCGFAGFAISGVFIPIKEMVDGVEVTTKYNFLGMIINADRIEHNWFTVGFINYEIIDLPDGGVGKKAVLGAPHAGLIGAMIAAAVTIYIEKSFRKFMPGALDTIITPILVILLMIVLNFILIIPLAGYLFTGITFLFNNLYQNPFGAAFLAGIFLFALALGVHQGFIPIYFALLNPVDPLPAGEIAVNGLFPIMCMGGAAQVGVSLAMWVLAGKGSILRKQISGAIIPGFLGIGEPLIYGITLPRVKPFFISCIGSAFGGFIMGALNTWGGLGIGMNSPTGPGGITAAIMMTTKTGNVLVGILVYLAVLFVVYGISAGLCFFGYSKIALHGSEKTTKMSKQWLATIKDKNQSFQTKLVSSLKEIGLILSYCTLIGIPIVWLTWYNKLDKETKTNLKQFKLV